MESISYEKILTDLEKRRKEWDEFWDKISAIMADESLNDPD